MVNDGVYLLKKRTFLPIFLTQFFGAMNDNTYKLSILTLISYHLSNAQIQSEHFQVLAGALYILPFFLVSATAGQLADKYDKASLTKLIKFFEIILMLIGSFAIYKHYITLMMLTLIGMGIHSAFFGPIKYAILPDHLLKSQLLKATALIEASTFLAIFIGTMLGSLSITGSKDQMNWAIILINIIALLGFCASLFIPKALPKDSELQINWHFWPATKEILKVGSLEPKMLSAIVAISWFWLIGAVMLTKLPDYTHYVLNADSSVFSFLLALFSIGIALGSLAISKILKDKLSLRSIPLVLLLLSIFALDLYYASPKIKIAMPLQTLQDFFSHFNNLRITFDLFNFSFCGGLFVVPLYTYLQVSSDEKRRARTIAMNNIFNALFMILGSLFVFIFVYFKVEIAFVFLMLAILNASVVVFWLLFRLIR